MRNFLLQLHKQYELDWTYRYKCVNIKVVQSCFQIPKNERKNGAFVVCIMFLLKLRKCDSFLIH